MNKLIFVMVKYCVFFAIGTECFEIVRASERYGSKG
jgi:hypothetical protein